MDRTPMESEFNKRAVLGPATFALPPTPKASIQSSPDVSHVAPPRDATLGQHRPLTSSLLCLKTPAVCHTPPRTHPTSHPFHTPF